MLKRLAIYVVHDQDGIVDDYIPYFLKELSSHIEHLIIVCNGILSEAGRAKLLLFTNDIFVRPNIGSEAGAVQDALLNLYGWEKIYQYDELLICNDTVFGPLVSFSGIFEEMDRREVDYWGLIAQSEQSPYFYNVKTNLLHAPVFRNFWEEIKASDSAMKVMERYPLGMANTFAEQGFTYSTYCDISPLCSDLPEYQYIYTQLEPLELIKRFKFPFVDKKAFSIVLDRLLDVADGYNLSQLMTYIDRRMPYDTGLIWQHILRKYSLRSIYESLHLHHVFSTASSAQNNLSNSRNAAVICHMHYKDLIGECLQYIADIPADIDIYVTTGNEEVRDLLVTEFSRFSDRRVEVRLVENRGRDTAALLIDCRDIWDKYEYLCFVHDKKTARGYGAPSVGKSFMRLLWENTLGSADYINNVLEHFETNPRLGFLGVQAPYHGNYFNCLLNSWSNDLELTIKLSDQLGLTVDLDRGNLPISLGTAFWCRTASMRPLYFHPFDRAEFPAEPAPVDETIMHAIERIFPFVAQHEGYYSGTMSTERYASARTVDMEYMLIGMAKVVGKFMPIMNYANATDFSFFDKLIAYCKKYRTLYIYGAGDYAARVANVLTGSNIAYKGFIVSDGKGKRGRGENNGTERASYMGHPVFYLSEVASLNPDFGIILGLNRDNASEVMPQLRGHGFNDVYKVF